METEVKKNCELCKNPLQKEDVKGIKKAGKWKRIW